MSDRYYKDDGYVNIRPGPAPSGGGGGFFSPGFGIGGSSRKRRKRRLAARRAREAAQRAALEQERQAREAAALVARRQAYEARYHTELLALAGVRQSAAERLEVDLREGLIRYGLAPSQFISDAPGAGYLQGEQEAVERLRHQLLAEQAQWLAQAQGFYGDAPGNHTLEHYLERVLPGGEPAHEQWREAMQAAQKAEALTDRLARLEERAAMLAREAAARQTQWRQGEATQARYREINAGRDINVKALQRLRESLRALEWREHNTLRVSAAALAGPAVISGATEVIRTEALRLALRTLREAGAFVKPATDLARKPMFWTLLAYSPRLGDGELTAEQRRRFAVALPLTDMGAPQGPLSTGTSVALDYRLKAETVNGETAVHVVPTGAAIPAEVPVREAPWRAEANAYEVPTGDGAVPTLQVTMPAQDVSVANLAPALRGITDLSSFEAAPLPQGGLSRFDDCILVFPIGSGIAPCYLAFEEVLTGGGLALGSGRGSVDLGQLLAAPTPVALPEAVAASLQWRTFDSTQALSAQVWRAFASQADQGRPGLSEINRNRLRKGYAPLLPREHWRDTQRTLQLGYIRPPQSLAEAYSADNLQLSAQGGRPLLPASQPVRTPWLEAHPGQAERIAAAHAEQRAAALTDLRQGAAADQQAETEARARAYEARWLRDAYRFAHVRTVNASAAYLLSPAGEILIDDAAGASIHTSLQSALVELERAADLEFAVDVLDLAFETPEGSFPPGIALSIPLQWLAPEQAAALDAASPASTAELSYRLGSLTEYSGASLFVTRTGVQGVEPTVPIVRARWDAASSSWVLIDDASGRRLTWTPASAPGADALGGTTLPVMPALVGLYTGRGEPIAEPHLETYPGLHDWDIDDFIVVYPADTGLPPEYIMFSEAWRRYAPGVVSGSGKVVEGQWLDEKVNTLGVPVPATVAQRLGGKSYSSFDSFRRAFWRVVRAERGLLPDGSRRSGLARRGGSPFAESSQHVGSRKRLELHHIKPISEGGAVYDLDNIIICSPKAHIDIHGER